MEVTLLESIGTAVSNMRDASIKAGSLTGTNSLTKLTKGARVEPITIVSKDLMTADFISDVLNNALNLFIGYYSQAVSMMTEVSGIRVARVLDKLNPNRDIYTALASLESHTDKDIVDHLVHFSLENYEYRLPSTLNQKALKEQLMVPSLEAEENEEISEEDKNKKNKNKAELKESSLKKVYESGNLMVGKSVDIKLSVNGQEASLPIIFNLTGVPLPNATVLTMLTSKSQDRSVKELWHGWRSGRLSFWKDIVLADELVKEHRKALMTDTTGVYEEIFQRARKNGVLGVLSKDASLATASNIFVISSELAEDIEYRLGGRLNDFKFRQRVFDSTFGMFLIIVDRQYERVIIYYNGIKLPTNVSLKDVKGSTKKSGGGEELTDVMKDLLSGRPPNFM